MTSFFSPALPDTAPTAGNRASGEFVVTDTREDLAAVLTWQDPTTVANISDDLDLELTWCGADNDCATTADNVTWISTMFTDDNDQDGTFSETGAVDILADGKVTGWWYSMSETDVTSRGGTIANYRWKYDNTEAVFLPTFRQAILSEDDNRDGTPDNKFLEYRNGTETGCPAGALGPDHCARTGKWRVTVFRNTGTTANLRYAVAVAGPVVAQSKVVIDKNPLTCNDEATVTIYETPDATDPSCKAANNCPLATIQSRTTLKVKNAAGATLDSETNLTVRQRFANQMIYEVRPPVPLSKLVAATPGDGVLTVQSGQFVVAEYADVKSATTAVRARHVEKIYEEIVRQHSGAVGQDAVLRLIGVSIQRAHAAHENRHLGHAQIQQLGFVDEHFGRRPVARLAVVIPETVRRGFQ